MPRKSSNPLTEQKQRLAAEQERLVREMAAMEKLARQKPKPVRATLEPGRRLRVETTGGRVLPPRPRSHIFPTSDQHTTRPQSRRRRKKEARLGQKRFVLLCFILAAVLFFVWKSLP